MTVQHFVTFIKCCKSSALAPSFPSESLRIDFTLLLKEV